VSGDLFPWHHRVSSAPAPMRALLFAALLLLTSAPAFAQGDDDAPLPYDDNDTGSAYDDSPRELPKKSRRSVDLREEDEEASEREESLSWVDDPNIGLSGELMTGAMLLESSRGALVDPRFLWGLRFTWEWGRLFPDPSLKEMFFADVSWCYAGTHDGTAQVYADSNQHYFTLAPAIALPFGPRSPVAFFAQAGLGFNLNHSAVHLNGNETNIDGAKFLLQYGIGVRFRPALTHDESVRLSFRLELTRFLRGYMSDTLLGGSVGVTF